MSPKRPSSAFKSGSAPKHSHIAIRLAGPACTSAEYFHHTGSPGNCGWAEPQEPVAVWEWMMY
ncbi:MAG: hypothetical protein ABIH23_14055 [bacterium]